MADSSRHGGDRGRESSPPCACPASRKPSSARPPHRSCDTRAAARCRSAADQQRLALGGARSRCRAGRRPCTSSPASSSHSRFVPGPDILEQELDHPPLRCTRITRDRPREERALPFAPAPALGRGQHVELPGAARVGSRRSEHDVAARARHRPSTTARRRPNGALIAAELLQRHDRGSPSRARRSREPPPGRRPAS